MKLKVYLAELNMTVKEFSKSIDYSKEYIGSIASGRLLPSKRLAKKIEKATFGQVVIQSSQKLELSRKKKQLNKPGLSAFLRICCSIQNNFYKECALYEDKNVVSFQPPCIVPLRVNKFL